MGKLRLDSASLCQDGNKDVAVCVECKRVPPDEQWVSCCYLIEEMLEVMLGKDRVGHISWKCGERPGKEFMEIMSSSIFRKIAEKHAPWRLGGSSGAI
ncbi:hypothetical protein [Pseudoduganella namucuonensis]|uniref:hypothetical protein n=1 Tax=Pseudoduganella namucuonensis TaxID=1035707 RepID=UPI0011605AA6|nr:hypothetical protein [Pseudoduganella namucuonensis]